MSREEHRAEIDRRSDAIRDEIDAGDWKFVEKCLAAAPEAQRREFYTACIDQLLPTSAALMNYRLRAMAEPLQDAVALGIAERVDREMQP